jgi:hypothetical protein
MLGRRSPQRSLFDVVLAEYSHPSGCTGTWWSLIHAPLVVVMRAAQHAVADIISGEDVRFRPRQAWPALTFRNCLYLENKRLCGGRLEFDADRTTG